MIFTEHQASIFKNKTNGQHYIALSKKEFKELKFKDPKYIKFKDVEFLE